MNPNELAQSATALSDRARQLAEEAQALALNSKLLAAHGGATLHLDPAVMGLTVFVLACFIGYYVVWRVTPALHSPLMAVTNAISSVIIVGALIAAGPAKFDFSKVMGFVAVALASVNIFGGFIVTQRMLQMFKKKKVGAAGGGFVSANASALAYLLASVLFILALRGLSSPETARRGNLFAMAGMVIAIATTLATPQVMSFGAIIGAILVGAAIGSFIAWKIQMTALPQLVAAFHSLVGLAAVCVAAAAFFSPSEYGIGTVGEIRTQSLIEMAIGLAIGAVTFTGSIVAFAKLQGLVTGAPLVFPGQHLLNAALGIAILVLGVWFVIDQVPAAFVLLALVAFVVGFLLIVPIGGADMPVVISMLNSYSGWAASGIGFTLENNLLIVTGALVGSSGAILSYIMCKGMNRSIFNVILGGFGTEGGAAAVGGRGDRAVKAGSAEDAAFIMKNARSVIIVPGYGMAVAQAQHALREMADKLKEEGVSVRYAIHPVAGRMPGHMNVLLAEANVPYDEVLELDEINRDFPTTDVAFVIGANDVTNPAAKTDPQSPIYGMPILDVERAKTVLFIKRSMATGYAGVDNELFFRDNTMMLFGDAKKVTEEVVAALN